MSPRPAVLAVLATLAVASGCLGAPGEPAAGTTEPTAGSPGTDRTAAPTATATPVAVTGFESYVFDHAGVDGRAIEGGIRYPDDDGYTERYYVTVVGSAAAAERFNHSVLDEGASAFVRATDFDDASLVVVQAFPASSHPDYRVESVTRRGGRLHAAINDSSRGGTADITVETVLVRVPGDAPERVRVTTEDGTAFESTGEVVTVTETPTATPGSVSLPYTAASDDGNVAEPRDLRVENAGDDVNGYRVSVVYREEPDCRERTPDCGTPGHGADVLDRTGKLRPGDTLTVEDAVARRGNYTVAVQASVPAGDGSRETIARSFVWTVDGAGGDAVVVITDDGVSFESGRG